MKNVNYIINGILAVAVVILFVMQLSGKKETSTANPTISGDGNASVRTLPVAYINVDSLLENYNYAKDLNEIILKKAENSRANVNQKAASLQKEMEEFQRKITNNAFLTRERAEQEQQRLVNKRQELQDLDTRLSQELMTEQQKLNEQLRDSIVSQLKIFNQNKGFEIILSNTSGDNILLANDAYNITAELLEYLNKNYATK